LAATRSRKTSGTSSIRSPATVRRRIVSSMKP
jgi:hypothetical protein